MSKKIYYFAADANMGDTSPENCDLYRAWAKEQIQAAYPDAMVKVDYSDGDNLARGFDSEESPEGDGEVIEFLSNLWDSCPWSWVK